MADKEITLKVTTETEIEPLEELDESLEEIQDKSEVKVEVDDTSIDEATDKTESLNEDLEETDDTTVAPDVDSSGFDELIDIAGEIRDQLEEINNTTVSPEVDTSNIEKANEDLEETESSIDNVKTAIVGLVATAEIEHMATVADNINTSWNRLELTFDGTGVAVDDLKAKIDEASAVTSRSGGVIREYFNQMGIAGVTNINLLAQSFESLSGKAYQTGNSIESMEAKMQTMVLTGNASSKMLKGLGLSAESLAAAIGVSVEDLSDAFSALSPEQRLQAITIAMGDGAAANAMYGDSYEAMKAKADASMAGLEGAVGQAILPTVIPALDAGTQAVKGLTEGFKNLPTPVQNAIGTTMGVAAIGTTAIGTFGEFAGAIANLGDAYGVLQGVYEALIPVEYAEGTAGWFSIGWIAAAILIGIALGLALIYLYNHSEKFRNAVQWLGDKLKWLSSIIVSNVTNAVNQVSTIFQRIPQALQNCLNWAYNLVMSHPLVQALIWLGNQASNAFSKIGLGQSSPGKIVKAMRQELDWTQEAIEGSDLASSTARLGDSLSNSFNPHLNVINDNYRTGNSGTGVGQNITVNLEIGSVDNDDRVNEIVEAVRKALAWDNKTAGRTV